jgi:hypothetical protein
MRKQGIRGRLIAGAAGLTAALALAPAVAAGAGTGLVTAKVPAGQTIAQLRAQLFIQRVSCTQICDLTTTAVVSLDDARRLGFKGTTPWVTVASSYIRLKANKTTEVRLVVTPQGTKLLAKAKGSLRVVGRLVAHPRAKPAAVGRASWSVVLK